MAFPTSFGQKLNAKERSRSGDGISSIVDQSEAVTGDGKKTKASYLPKVNVQNCVGSYYLNLLLREGGKEKGRKKLNSDIKIGQKTK
jgi:hypothetical protein